ncbi:MAG: hypothetical protein EPO20_30540 [Betaproteobacteria bacterium]|nr:MAG: hypothetical protein EPO20_30540 [Betaproteobacteria bacterium]
MNLLGRETAYKGTSAAGKDKCQGRESGQRKGIAPSFPGLEPSNNLSISKDAGQHYFDRNRAEKSRNEHNPEFNINNGEGKGIYQGAETGGQFTEKTEQ